MRTTPSRRRFAEMLARPEQPLDLAEGAQDRRDRGLAYAALDCYVPAAEDLEAYLSLAPAAVDATAIAARIVDLRWRATRLN